MSTSDLDNVYIQQVPKQTQYELFKVSLIAGVISNMCGTLAGHPLDTVRVRMQLEKRKITTRQCAYEALVKEGPFSLYKGVSQPIVGATPINTIIFVVEEATKDRLRHHYPEMNYSKQAFYAGSAAGLASLSIFVPLDLLKIRAQTHTEGRFNYLNEMRYIKSTQGVSGFYRGLLASAARDIPGWAVYFSSYEWLKLKGKQLETNYPVQEKYQHYRTFLWSLNAGGIAGVLSWICSLPQDIIKSKQQAHSEIEPLRFRQAWNQVMMEGGMKGLFKGVAPTLARGYLVNMVTLPLFDAIKGKLEE